ncbi:MAG: hypothetical protein RL148_3101 [Planctomycetota bacterium]|jgi:hypothetical protein
MCLLIVMRGLHASHPVVVGANRDERTDRAFSPPGLFVGRHRRILSPRDRQAGGTWIGVNDLGAFAAVTNLKGHLPPAGAPSRGHLVHLALDASSLSEAVDLVGEAVRSAPHGGFQLALCDRDRIVVLVHRGGVLDVVAWREPVLVVTNEHAPGVLHLPLLAHAMDPMLGLHERLDRLAPVLRDRGDSSGHAVLKKGAGYGTVSSSLLAVPASDPTALVWRFAAGAPDEAVHRNYGNLGRRLLPEAED